MHHSLSANAKSRNGLDKLDSYRKKTVQGRPFLVKREPCLDTGARLDAEENNALNTAGLETTTINPGSASRVTSLETIWRKMAGAIVICDAQGKIILTNIAARELAQIDPQDMPIECAPLIWGRMIDVEGHEIAPADWPTMRATRGYTTTQQECRLVWEQGVHHDVLFSAAPLGRGASAGVLATLTDITQLQRRALMLRQRAVSRERNRMAEDIHDAFCQGLNAILLQLENAQSCITKDCESAMRHVKNACDVARGSLAEARQSMWTFCHESLGDIDPACRLSEVARQIVRGTGISLALSLQPQPRALPPKVPLELLRISQEALSNVVKHSRAKKVSVTLVYKKWAVLLLVQDDGRGFTRTSLDPRQRGFGLICMQERAERLGGKLCMHSRPGWGTRIAAIIPLCSQCGS